MTIEIAQAPTLTDWVESMGTVAAAWVGVGALLIDRRTRDRAESTRKRNVHAWVRYVDDDIEVSPAWTLFVTNGVGVPVDAWSILLDSNETIDANDLGPLAPGTTRRQIEPSNPSEKPRVAHLVFQDPDGAIVLKHTYSDSKVVKEWPEWADARPEQAPRK